MNILRGEFPWPALKPDSPRLHNIDLMRGLQAPLDILFHQEGSDPFCVDLLHPLIDALDDQGRETQRYFIKQDEPWLAHESPTNGQHLLFPSARVLESWFFLSPRTGNSS